MYGELHNMYSIGLKNWSCDVLITTAILSGERRLCDGHVSTMIVVKLYRTWNHCIWTEPRTVLLMRAWTLGMWNKDNLNFVTNVLIFCINIICSVSTTQMWKHMFLDYLERKTILTDVVKMKRQASVKIIYLSSIY